jgi:uncharacterized phage protein (TIGR02220 family)
MRIKNWEKHQHFKDRRPPWIKVYRDILEDPDWHELDGQSAKVLVMLWLLASEDKEQNGKIPCLRKLSFRLRMTEHQVSQILQKLKHWLIQDDATVISSLCQVGPPETETETETETEGTNVPCRAEQPDTDEESLVVEKERVPYRKIIAHLNTAAQRDFKPTVNATRQKIKARWAEGHRLPDFLAVIDHKTDEWLGNDKMQQYLRPETLFGTKFESYLVTARAAGAGAEPKMRWNG